MVCRPSSTEVNDADCGAVGSGWRCSANVGDFLEEPHRRIGRIVDFNKDVTKNNRAPCKVRFGAPSCTIQRESVRLWVPHRRFGGVRYPTGLQHGTYPMDLILSDFFQWGQLASLDKNNALREIKLRLSYLQGKSTTMSVIAHQTEKEWISENEKSRQRMSQTQAEGAAKQHAARLEEAHLRAHHSCFTTSERC
ncbi:hypothetical protein TNCV_542681 [Trichonephila clavipes]|nr:hypothetical protein TNCV_542681 [Trichonephila clavipes]